MKTLRTFLVIAGIVGAGIIAAHAEPFKPMQTVDYVGPRSVAGAGVMPAPLVELALVHQTPTSLPTPLIEQPEKVVLLPNSAPVLPGL